MQICIEQYKETTQIVIHWSELTYQSTKMGNGCRYHHFQHLH